MANIEFSFDGPRHVAVNQDELIAAVEKELGGSAVEPSAPPASTPPAPAAAAQPPAVDPLAVPAAPAAAAEPAKAEDPKPQAEDLRTFEIVVDGQPLTVTEADLKAGHMRHRDYTQKTQRIAERERDFQAKEAKYQADLLAREQELTQLDEFLKNKAAVDAYYQRAFGASQAVPPPQIDPNQPISAQQVAEIARYNAEQVRIQTLSEVEAVRQQALKIQQDQLNADRAREADRIQQDVDRHIASLLDKFPALAQLGEREDIQEELMIQAAKFPSRAATVAERLADAKARLTEAAERRVAVIQKIAENAKKDAAVAAAKVKAASPEPSGGSPVKQDPPKKLTLDYRDRKARIDAGVADVEAFLRQNT